MHIEVDGDAYRILEHFLRYASDRRAKELADAMFYDEDGFRNRVRCLEKAFLEALENEPQPK